MAEELALTLAGERGLYLATGPEGVDEATNLRVQALARALRERPLAGLREVVPGYWNLYAEFAGLRPALAALRQWIARAEESAAGATEAGPREHSIPVLYGGPGLAETARLTGLTPAEVIRRHAAPSYRVFALGFTPGFAYLGTLDEALRLPRLASPRQVVAGSVAIAGAQTGVYPTAGPGGWRMLGRTDQPLFDRAAGLPLLRPGDIVRFQPVDSLPVPPTTRVPETFPGGEPLFRVLEPGMLDTIQDLGRHGVGFLSLPQAGALDARALSHANSLLGNDSGAPCLEVTLRGPVLEVLRPTSLAVAGNGGGCRVLRMRRGEVLDLSGPTAGARAYLAVPGGFAARRVHSSAATDLRAGIGGLDGRALAAGDLLFAPEGTRQAVIRESGLAWRPRGELVLRVLPGPQATFFPPAAWRRLTGGPYQVAAADRMGLRLRGPRLEGERHEIVSEAAPLGSIQVPPDGQPILLLNDRGTLGGYPKIALVVARDLPLAGQLREGQALHFRLRL